MTLDWLKLTNTGTTVHPSFTIKGGLLELKAIQQKFPQVRAKVESCK